VNDRPETPRVRRESVEKMPRVRRESLEKKLKKQKRDKQAMLALRERAKLPGKKGRQARRKLKSLGATVRRRHPDGPIVVKSVVSGGLPGLGKRR
jgi:hypothetical protein